jgi:Flp pilus assembly pilin Flp
MRLFSRFSGDGRGTTAVEFALLAFPFALLVFAILEVCIFFAAQQVLANATDNVARQLRTGQLKAADMTAEKLRQLICDHLEVIVASGCPGLAVDLRTAETFAELADIDPPLTGTGDNRELGNTEFHMGLSQQKNMLRVLYPWPVMTNIMQEKMSNLKGNKALLFAANTWQNEPFDD